MVKGKNLPQKTPFKPIKRTSLNGIKPISASIHEMGKKKKTSVELKKQSKTNGTLFAIMVITIHALYFDSIIYMNIHKLVSNMLLSFLDH